MHVRFALLAFFLVVSNFSYALPFALGTENDSLLAQNPDLRSAYLMSDVNAEQAMALGPADESLVNHFDAVLEILEFQSDTSLEEAFEQLTISHGPLTDEQTDRMKERLAVRRARQMDLLRQYKRRGLFPKNLGDSRNAIPIFKDGNQTHCAVGYLMHRDGSDDIVEEIVTSNNYVHVNDIEIDSALEWILSSGLTQSEAALIQPAYTPPSFDVTLVDFLKPGFSFTKHGLKISELFVLQYSYDSTLLGDVFTPFEIGQMFIDKNGEDLDPTTFGVGIGQGTYSEPDFGFEYNPAFENWLFLGGLLSPLGVADFGDDTVMYKIGYRIEAEDDRYMPQMSTSSSANFNFNVVMQEGSEIRIATRAFDDSMEFLGEGAIQGLESNGDFFITDSSTFSAGGKSLHVVSYAMDHKPGAIFDFQYGFTSYWNSFELILVGDVNCDGSIDLLDVGPFVDAITNDFPEAKADTNMDGSDDLLDVVSFVELIAGS